MNTQLSLTIKLLKADPGETRDRIADKYKKNALSMQENFNPLWNALGAAMLVLGTAMTAIGIVLSATGGGIIPGIGIAACGTLLATTGFGLFTHSNKFKKLTDMTLALVEDSPGKISMCV